MPPCIVPVAKKMPTDFICILRSIRNPVFGGSRIIVTVPFGNIYFRLVNYRKATGVASTDGGDCRYPSLVEVAMRNKPTTRPKVLSCAVHDES
jgi:hypothetical protein